MSEPMEDKRLAVDEFIRYHHNPIVGQKNKEIADLQAQLITIKELINGASLRPEAGVSLVDDVRDLVKERDRLTYAIGEWKKEEVLWKEREADLLAKLSVCKEGLEKINNGVILGCGHGSIAKAALEGGK